TIGRWMTVDPLADVDEQIDKSPYAWNNPINLTDPDGMVPCRGCAVGAGVTAGGIIGGALAAGGVVAATGTVTVVGAPVGYVVAGGIVLGGIIGGGTVALYNYFHKSSSTEESTYKAAAVTPPKVVTPDSQTETEKKSNVSNGNKNSPHANQKAKESAQEKADAAKSRYQELKSKPNKTKDDKAAEAKAKTEMEHQQRKAAEKGENHSQKAKGSN
ncbi:MAG: hypothetical protein JWQ25_2471, partial [Daejeonella sp.]|nr:hypothetical protein [Daejeonella sp.]